MDNIIEPKPKNTDGLLCIEVFDRQGKLIERSYGLNFAESLAMHKAGRCSAFCGHCYEEVMDSIEMEY